MADVLRQTQAASGAITGTLRLDQLTATCGGPHLLRVIEAFEARHPECEVEVSMAQVDDPFGPLRRGEVDLMTSWLPLEQPDLVVGPTLFSEPRVLTVAHDHPLAGADRVSIEDLADHRIPRFEQVPEELREAWIPSQTPSGRPIPGVSLHLREHDLAYLAERIARGKLVHPTVPSAAAYMGDLDLVYVPIADMPPLHSGLLWRRDNDDPRVRGFADVAEETLD
jgi:DNA-binding transcriptional LysR family regulator